ncbi:MAG: hypothetical protein HUU18_05215 [Phycisphaerales bacterium]|nr:hypothetical protein [Phycisphaerales bacterium]
MKKKIKMKPKQKVTNAANVRPQWHEPNSNKFAKGNPGGPGNPHTQRIHEYNAAIREAVSSGDIAEVMRVMVRRAKRGDQFASKLLLDRCIGKSRPMDLPITGLQLPEMATAADTVKATNAIVRATRDGTITTEQAAALASLVELTRRSIETHQLAERLAQLEQEIGR